DEIAAALAAGYGARLGVAIAPRAVTEEEQRTIAAHAAGAFADARWLRRPRPDLDRRLSIGGQAGAPAADFAVADGDRRGPVPAGDVIANSGAVDALEATLRGCPLERAEIARRVRAVLEAPDNFLLGLGRPPAAAEALARGLAP